jgi:hypothetical protein
MRTSRDHAAYFGPLLAGIAVWLLCMGGGPAGAQATSARSLCAVRDVQVITLIEEHGMADDIAPERLAKAGLAQMDARLQCSTGRVEEGVALYDGIIGSLGPILSRRTQ